MTLQPNSTQTPNAKPATDTVEFAELPGDYIVVRVHGRGSFANSGELKNLFEAMCEKHGVGNYRIIIDLADCETMDSTFLGVLASCGLRHKRECPDRLVFVNVNEQCRRLLQTLGIAQFTTVRAAGSAAQIPANVTFETVERTGTSRLDQIIHMIEAHQTLCDIETKNTAQFEGVLKYLEDSLKREKEK